MSPPPLSFHVNDPNFYAGDPYPMYKRLREEAPVYWDAKEEIWCITKLSDVQSISRDPTRFRSAQGVLINDKYRKVPKRESILSTDPPYHRQARKLVHAAFTRRRIASLESRVQELVVECLAGIQAGITVDFAEQVSIPLPILVIAELMGIPREDRQRFQRWSDAVMVAAETQDSDNMQVVSELITYLNGTLEERAKNPGDDLVSTVLATRVDDKSLSHVELIVFCMTLLVAGNETTRTLMSNGLIALADNPEQMAKLVADPSLVDYAVEEMLRYDPPIQSFTRTASEQVTISGTTIEAEQRVVLLYGAANRDSEAFGDNAEDFVVDRTPGRHVTFCGILKR